MAYCLSVDGGGTKLACVLFDEQYNLLAYGQGRAINYVKHEDIVGTIRSCIGECLANHNVKELACVYISMPASAELFTELLRERVTVHNIIYLNEGLMSLLAGLQCKQGIVALAGTGSGLFHVNGDDWSHVGGWGNLLGDEGSACYIGREGIGAVLQEYELRGVKTAIRDRLEREWNCHNKQELLDYVYHSDKPRSTIASASILVAQEAALGDERAIHIFEQAGREMALQAKVFLDRLSAADSVHIMLAGSVWRGCEQMYNTFKQEIYSFHPGASVRIPLFEPVLGGVVANFLDTREKADNEFRAHLSQQYARYLYQTDWERR